MSRNVIETLLGAVVLVVAIGFLAYAYSNSRLADPTGYELIARFDRVDGLDVGGEVRMSGIRIGRVVAQTLDPVSYRAEVRFTVRRDIEVPRDSSASIASASLLGGKYLAIVPGAEDEVLSPGGEITITQSSISIEDLVGQFMFSQ